MPTTKKHQEKTGEQALQKQGNTKETEKNKEKTAEQVPIAALQK